MRVLPETHMSYPLSITIGSSSGSGFLLNRDSTIYVVSAKHVFYDQLGKLHADQARCVTLHAPTNEKSVITFDLTKADVRPHATADVVVVKVGTFNANKRVSWEEGVSISAGPSGYKLFGVKADDSIQLADVIVSNDVYIFGYPTSLGIAGQLDKERPLIRKGIVADKDPTKEIIVIDCPLYQGNSGGLVIEVREVSLGSFKSGPIGVATSFVPFVEHFQSLQFGTVNTALENSGYGIVTPIDRVLELV